MSDKNSSSENTARSSFSDEQLTQMYDSMVVSELRRLAQEHAERVANRRYWNDYPYQPGPGLPQPFPRTFGGPLKITC